MTRPGYAWVILGTLGLTETVSYGVTTYAFAVLLVPMEHDLGWSQTALTGAFSVALLVSGLASPRVGRTLDRRSPRLLMTGGSLLCAAMVLAWSRVTTLPELYATFALLGLGMALVLYEPAFVVVTKWFPARRHRALTTLTLIAAASSFVFSPLTQHLVAGHGWRDATALLALVLLVVTVPLHALVLREAPRMQERPQAEAPRPPVGSFRLLAAAFALSSFASVAVAVFLVSLLVGAGHTAAFAATAAGLMGLAQIPGRLLLALVGRVAGPRAAAVGTFGLGAAALALLAVDESTWVVGVFVLCFGMSNGMATLLRATLVGDIYGSARYGAAAGRVSAFVLLARAAAPFGAALVVTAGGGYAPLLVVLGVGCAAAAVALGRALAPERLMFSASG